MVVGHTSSALTSGQYAPAGSAVCCGMCLTGRVLEEDSKCESKNRCNGKGLCLMGMCQCFEGWTGPTCDLAAATGSSGFGLPSWLFTFLIFATCIIASFVFGCSKALCEHCIRARSGDTSSSVAFREPLLRMHGDGSAGSWDTHVSGGGSVESHVDEDDEAAAAERKVGHPASDIAHVADTEPVLKVSPKGAETGRVGKEGLVGSTCSICWSRPVQVVLVPCGHSGLCR